MVLLFMRKDNGFTLVEMMTVIAIMAIVSAIAVPNIYSFAAGMKLRSASRDLCSTLRQARMNAIRTNTRWAVQFGAANYQAIDCGPDNTCGTGDDVVKIPTSIPPGVTMSRDFAGNQTVFNADGTSTSAIITKTTLTNTKGTSDITVAPSGRIIIISP